MLNKLREGSNMYPWVNATWNPISGICCHNCQYCYYQNNPRFKSNISVLRLNERALKDDLGKGNFIFIGSSTDAFSESVDLDWIEKVLEQCNKYPENTYFFQTKNPKRFREFIDKYPKKRIFCITLETNRYYPEMGNAPKPKQRAKSFSMMDGEERVITIEPIMDFDLIEFVNLIKICEPKWVNIGADSKGHNLPEPSKEKIELLIKELEKFTEVKKKDNLKRLLN